MNQLELLKPTTKGRSKKKRENKDNGSTNFKESKVEFMGALATLLDISEQEVYENCCISHIKEFLSSIGLLVVRYGIENKEAEKKINNAETLSLEGIYLSPAYFKNFTNLKEKAKIQRNLLKGFIDFPFGESTLKSKLDGIREAKRSGIEDAIVMIPSNLLFAENKKELNLTIKKIGKLTKGKGGIAFSGTDFDPNNLKKLFKFIARRKIKEITLVFGDVSYEEFREKLNTVFDVKGSEVVVNVCGNVQTKEAVMELKKLKVNKIITPYAIEIGEDLLKTFDIKKIKLL